MDLLKNKKQIIAAVVFILFFIISVFIVGRQNRKNIQTDALNLNSIPTVIIDAGHGGADGGTVAVDGTPEKDINLQIALNMRDFCVAAGIPFIMTRTEDISVHSEEAKTIRQQKVSDIHNRSKLLEGTDNAVLISIHQNEFSDSSCFGTQVFYSPNNQLSQKLADSIQECVIADIQPENKRVIKKSGTGIYILYHAQKPAVMVECGFLSNQNDTKKLKDSSYQSKIVISIMHGFFKYLSEQEIS